MNSKYFKNLIVGTFLLLPVVTFAAPFTPLVGIPGISDPSTNFGDYINALYALSISIAGLLAVIKIIIAGVKYMLSDVVTNKQSAIEDIKGALLGLLIVLAAYLVLYTINPELTKSNLFLAPVDQAAQNGGSGGSSSGASSPMPQIGNTSPAGPVTRGDIKCDPIPNITNSYNCDAAKAKCVSTPGIVVPEGSTFNRPSDITCKYGNSVPMQCQHGGINYSDVGPATYDNLDCSAQRTNCLSNAGGIFTEPAAGSYTGSCYTPVRPATTAGSAN